jgi:hypothetical protein
VAKIELYDKTQTLLISFKKKFTDLQTLCQKIAHRPEAKKILTACLEFKKMNDTVEDWLKKTNDIDLSAISDAITDLPLRGRVYSLEGKGWILEETRQKLSENPFTTYRYESTADRDAKIPLLSEDEMQKLDSQRQQIARQIDALRPIFLVKKRQKLL